MSREVAAGDEADAWCTRCKLVLNHVIVALLEGRPKRVQCLTCQGQHDYRDGPPALRSKPAARATAAAPKRRAPALVPIPDEATVPGRDYAMSDSFAEGEIVRHAQYGRGRVTRVRGNKLDVDFSGTPRTLAQAAKR